jgi:hypothetical protein
MKTITLELTEQEAGNLTAVIDAGVKAAGLQVVLPLAPILDKLNAAISEKSNGAIGSPDAGPDAMQLAMTKETSNGHADL